MRVHHFFSFILTIICVFSLNLSAQAAPQTDGQKRMFAFNACLKYKKNENVCRCEANTIQREFSAEEWEQYYKLNTSKSKQETGLTNEQIKSITDKVKKAGSNCLSNSLKCKRRCPYNGACLEYY